ncbi:MAG: hypothetical protein ACW972_11000, partial [Promethearchaeota archaeon]
ISFSLVRKPSTWVLFPLFQNISLDIILRTDVNYDIVASTSTGSIGLDISENANVNNTILATSTGSIQVTAKENVTINGKVQTTTSTGSVTIYAQNVNFSQGLSSTLSTGSLLLNFTNCIVGDDISGTLSTGSITLRSYNMKYSQNCVWDLETSTGGINAVITQYVEMGANITGSMETSTGSIDINYIDNLATVGASFLGTWSTGSYTRSSSGGGFSATNFNPFFSLDYSTANNIYTLSLTTSTGGIDVDGTSV